MENVWFREPDAKLEVKITRLRNEELRYLRENRLTAAMERNKEWNAVLDVLITRGYGNVHEGHTQADG